MKRKTSSSLLKFPVGESNCVVMPRIINNIAFISNRSLPVMEMSCDVNSGSASDSVEILGDELIISHFAEKIKMGNVVVGAS